MEYHIPVMVQECLEGLQIQPGGLYVDATFGGGGHSRAIVEMLKNGHLYGFDWDPDAEQNKGKLDQTRFTLIKANFRFMEKYLRIHGVKKVDGILADLGVSSHQLDKVLQVGSEDPPNILVPSQVCDTPLALIPPNIFEPDLKILSGP